MKKSLVFVLIVGIAVWGGMHFWHSASAARPEFRTMTVTRGDITVFVSATGLVEPLETIEVGAQIPGMIKKFGPDPNRAGKTVDYGSRVKEGQILAQLDDAPHQSELKKAVANLRLAESELARCDAHFKQAESAYRRAERLIETNSQSEYENAVANFETAKAESGVAAAKLEQAKIAKELAEVNMGYTVIRSPVEGVIIDRKVNVGQTVIAGLNAPILFLLAKDMSHMRVTASVNEADMGDVHVGQPVTFKVDAFHDRSFSGTVSKIRYDAASVQSVVTYPVVVEVENRDEKLLPYMTAKLQFEVARRANAIRVPNQALRWQPTLAQISPSERNRAKMAIVKEKETSSQDSDGAAAEGEQTVDLGPSTVWVVASDGFVRPIEVQTGLSDGIFTEIAGGKLDEKMEVVIHATREAQPDFVKSFISQVVNTKK